ncbi:UDP-glucuronic acid decarboxylase family protein [Pseudorhizobium marinum]|uniref:UDP-glucuronic acid decarboxylase family protein n=1 Tax=Pseudorhizobium marinum TaxID=1496690 RepID=UPI00068E6644|nr:UDP-glucuronic acid decarboxylase family protein [Pseudorhizobium marinum]
MKNVLITGGAGFLGAHLCERVLAAGNRVICLDNLYTGSKANIEHFLSHPNFQFREWDVCDPLDIEVDEIYNFACPASPPHYQADPVRTMKISVLGALNMLDLAKKYGAKIIQASTSEIYGDPLVHPQTESYWGNVNSIGIRACYDEGKRAAETLFYDYHRQYGVNIRVVRIFNTYGPGMNAEDGRVVSNFIVQALKGEDLTIYGDGSQTRSFCYRDDLVEGIIRLMNAPDEVTFPVNIGNPNEFTVRQLAEIVLELTGSKSQLILLPLPQDDPTQRCPDISRAQDHLAWQPNVELREGILRTIEYFNDQLSNFNRLNRASRVEASA